MLEWLYSFIFKVWESKCIKVERWKNSNFICKFKD